MSFAGQPELWVELAKSRKKFFVVTRHNEDGANILFLHTRGRKKVPCEAVQQLLRYMESTTYENAVNEELQEMHRMVETVKKDPKVGEMRIQIVECL